MHSVPPQQLLRIDHVGHAVLDLERSIDQYTQLFGFKVEVREELPEHGVVTAFLSLANSSIELLSPLPEGSPLPGGNKLRKFIETKGEGLHHICYEVASVAEELTRLKSLGTNLIDQSPRPGARGSEIAFIHPHALSGVLTEICSYPA